MQFPCHCRATTGTPRLIHHLDFILRTDFIQLFYVSFVGFSAWHGTCLFFCATIKARRHLGFGTGQNQNLEMLAKANKNRCLSMIWQRCYRIAAGLTASAGILTPAIGSTG